MGVRWRGAREIEQCQFLGFTPDGLEQFFDLVEEATKAGEAALRIWGSKAQASMAIEEMAELTTSLCQRARQRVDDDNVRSEIADVLIMAIQLTMLYGTEKTMSAIESKIVRLWERLSASGNGEK